MRIYRSLIAIVIAALAIVLSLWFSSAGAAQAADGCSQTYTVQPGDWLFAVARRFNIPVAELIRLNPQLARNPNLIYPGQVLCLSMTTTPPPDGEVSAPRAVAIEAGYQYSLTADESDWNLTARGGFLGKRRVLPLPGLDAIEVYSLTEDVFSAISKTAPVLLGVRNGVTATTYTLVFVGGQDILSSIHISGTVTPNPDCKKRAPTVQATLGLTDVLVQDVTVWLEGGGELRLPFHISNIDAKPDWSSASECYVPKLDMIGFALFPAVSGKPDEYRLLIRLTQEGYGPPGSRWYNRCVSLSYGGWFNWWFRRWACPRF